MPTDLTIQERYNIAPPIVRAAIDAILDLENNIDPMGYDISYYQYDIPHVVKTAIEPWDKLSW